MPFAGPKKGMSRRALTVRRGCIKRTVAPGNVPERRQRRTGSRSAKLRKTNAVADWRTGTVARPLQPRIPSPAFLCLPSPRPRGLWFGYRLEGKPMKPLTLIAAALTALVLAATPAFAPGTTAQAKPIMVADWSACAVEQPDTPALPANPGRLRQPTPPARGSSRVVPATAAQLTSRSAASRSRGDNCVSSR